MKVLFTSNRPLMRAENLKSVFDAYDGEKEFIHVNPYKLTVFQNGYSLRVADEIPGWTPGKCIFVGHGIAGLKTYGVDQPVPYATKEMMDKITYYIAPSKYTMGIIKKHLGIDDESRILPLGMPRTDELFKKPTKETEIYEGKTVYLYAPTYRTPKEMPYPKIDWQYINSKLNDDEVLLVKPHMLSYIHVEQYDKVKRIPSSIPSTPYIQICDVLITDYSSIMFDAYIANKPVVLYYSKKDLDMYSKNRGLYFKYPDEYCSVWCTNENDLVDTLRRAKMDGFKEQDKRELFCSECDGHSAERIVDLIKSMV